MKTSITRFLFGMLILLFLFSSTACLTLKSKSLPPGQAKKITGEQNAKDLAPGHNK